MREKKQARKVMMDAVAEARDEALVEIGREAEARQKIRVAKARRANAGKLALVAAAAGAALTAGAVVVRRRRAKTSGGTVPLSGQTQPPE